MPRRPARVRIHFIELGRWELTDYTERLYAVELRQGRTRRTIGRISGGGRSWMALPVGGAAWTRRHRTRTLALDALQCREDHRWPHTFTADRGAA